LEQEKGSGGAGVPPAGLRRDTITKNHQRDAGATDPLQLVAIKSGPRMWINFHNRKAPPFPPKMKKDGARQRTLTNGA